MWFYDNFSVLFTMLHQQHSWVLILVFMGSVYFNLSCFGIVAWPCQFGQQTISSVAGYHWITTISVNCHSLKGKHVLKMMLTWYACKFPYSLVDMALNMTLYDSRKYVKAVSWKAYKPPKLCCYEIISPLLICYVMFCCIIIWHKGAQHSGMAGIGLGCTFLLTWPLYISHN